ncbi:MAG TPA: hypothetical protein VEI97_10790, partial [bacterium]|nr:hypothetical protein [bacterium]
FNQPEAYRVEVELNEAFMEGDPPDRAIHGLVRITDWQAGLLGDGTYGDLSQPGKIPVTSDVALVTSEIPGLQDGAKTLAWTSGAGTAADPYVYPLPITNDLGAIEGAYLGLIGVVDTTDGQLSRPTASPEDRIYSFVTYQPFAVQVQAAGGNRPPVAAASADPNPIDSGVPLPLLDDDSFDPDPGDGISEYAWDFDVADGRAYTDSISAAPNQATVTYTNTGTEPITIIASLRVKDTFGFTNSVDLPIVVNPPAAGNNPPVAVPEVASSTVASGAVVALIDRNSYDLDPGDGITEYAWDFDVADGRTYTDSVSPTPDQASTTFTNPGTAPIQVTVSLRVKDVDGATDTADLEITVLSAGGGNNPPVAVPELLEPSYESGEEVRLIDFHSYDPDPGDSITEYAWDFNVANGRTYADSVSPLPNIAEAVYQNPSPNPITITASLRVKDEQGATGTEDLLITINPGAATCEAPPGAPAQFRVPTLPEAPYTTNFLTFQWTAPADPEGCLRGYAVYRAERVGTNTTPVLLTDLDNDNVLDPNEVITAATFADNTLARAGATRNKYYRYTVRAVSQSPSGLLQGAESNPVNVYINDFEGMEQLSGGTWRGTRSGFSWGLVNAFAYPDQTAFSYGFEIATDEGNGGSSYCLDESADIAAGGYGPTNHDPYAAANNFDNFIDDGYWNSFGPQLFTDLDSSLLPTGGTFRRMQLYHKYQFETYFDSGQGVDVAADMGYIAVIPHADWEANRFNRLIDLPVLEGKGYDSAAPGYNPFMDQQYWNPGDRNPSQQIPRMHFVAGDARINAGAPDWVKTVYDLTPARNMTQPVVQFAVASDEYLQQPDHIGWSIDDILMVCY